MSPARPEPSADPAEKHSSAAVEPDDHELIRRAQAGDEQAFAALVRRHQGRALRVARQMVPDADDAQDLAQEAFLRVFKSLERFDFRHEFSTWLYRIVSNLAIDHLRKRRPIAGGRAGDEDDERPFGFDLVDTDAPSPDAAAETEETAALVRRCIETLPPHFGVVLALRELEGLPCTEIARIVDATHVTVRWRLHRARKLFAEEWERRSRRDLFHDLDPLRSSAPTGRSAADGDGEEKRS
jgi:RNA polymerase sigma-70 factor (ECF subfamily)